MELYNIDIIYYLSSLAQLYLHIDRYTKSYFRETKKIFRRIAMTIISLDRLYEYIQNIGKIQSSHILSLIFVSNYFSL